MAVVDFKYEPVPIHIPFHQSAASERALAGAFGSGKSYAICAEAIAWALEQPGIRGLITRKTIPELRDTTETVFFDILPHEIYKAGTIRRLGGHVSEFIFPHGSKILFRGIDDWQKHKSLNVGFIAWDEADEFDEETYLGMKSRVRQKDLTNEARALGYTGQINRRGMWMAFNPAGHNWIYDRFINPAKKQPNTDWFRSTSFDNPHLPPEYVPDLIATYPEPWIRRYVLCQFDDFAGQIYEDWAWDTHVIEPLREYPDKAAFWMGMDPGTESPTAGLWVVVDAAQRRLVGISEYQETGLAAVKHALAWRKIEAQKKMNVSWRIADANSVTQRDRGSSMKLTDQYRRLGFRFSMGSNNPKIAIPALANLIHTGRFVLTRECPQTYEAIKNYRWEDLTPQQRAKGLDPRERPLKKNTHLVECAQYVSQRWLKPIKPEPELPPDGFSAEVHTAIRKRVRNRGKTIRQHDLGGVLI